MIVANFLMGIFATSIFYLYTFFLIYNLYKFINIFTNILIKKSLIFKRLHFGLQLKEIAAEFQTPYLKVSNFSFKILFQKFHPTTLFDIINHVVFKIAVPPFSPHKNKTNHPRKLKKKEFQS